MNPQQIVDEAHKLQQLSFRLCDINQEVLNKIKESPFYEYVKEQLNIQERTIKSSIRSKEKNANIYEGYPFRDIMDKNLEFYLYPFTEEELNFIKKESPNYKEPTSTEKRVSHVYIRGYCYICKDILPRKFYLVQDDTEIYDDDYEDCEKQFCLEYNCSKCSRGLYVPREILKKYEPYLYPTVFDM